MRLTSCPKRMTGLWMAVAAGLLGPASPTTAEVLDDFSNGVATRQTWTNDFQLGVGGYEVTNGQVKLFITPSADHGFSTLRSLRSFTVQEHRTLELRVDLVSSSHDGALARLGFGPECGAPDYANYVHFFDQDTSASPKRPAEDQVFWVTNFLSVNTTNVKMVLTLTGMPAGVVRIRARVLDNAQGGAVLFERTVDDTAAADLLERGTDNPPASLLGRPCRFMLGVYHDNASYLDPDVGIGRAERAEVVFDNAEFSEYDSAWLAPPSNALLLSWPENTVEEQIIVATDSLANAVWTPWPEPIYKRFGQVSMAVPTLNKQSSTSNSSPAARSSTTSATR